jgi:hypothetical protein
MEHPQSDAALSFPVEPDDELDARLERDLISQVSKLEQGRSYLAERATRLQPALALQAASAMLDAAIGFAERRLADEPDANADAVLSRASELEASIGALLKEFNPGGMQSFLSFLGRSTGNGAQLKNGVQRAMHDLPPALEGFFALWESRFRSPSAAKDWAQVYRVFLDDLRSVVDAF